MLKILFFLLIITFSSYSQTYQYAPLLQDDNIWKSTNNIYPQGNHVNWSYTTSITNNLKNINGIEYQEILSEQTSSRGSGDKLSYIREDTFNRYVINYYDLDRLLFDFNANKGDTLFEDSTKYFYFYIEKVDSIEINNSLRKRLYIKSNQGGPDSVFEYEWIEGIGSTKYGLLSTYAPDVGYGYKFIGLYRNNEKIYGPEIITKPIEKPKFVIYLNNSNSYFNIITDFEIEYSLFNFTGQKVLSNNLSNSKIDISFLNKGVYYLIIKYNGNEYESRKIIKGRIF